MSPSQCGPGRARLGWAMCYALECLQLELLNECQLSYVRFRVHASAVACANWLQSCCTTHARRRAQARTPAFTRTCGACNGWRCECQQARTSLPQSGPLLLQCGGPCEKRDKARNVQRATGNRARCNPENVFCNMRCARCNPESVFCNMRCARCDVGERSAE